jgi:hypothetical protein
LVAIGQKGPAWPWFEQSNPPDGILHIDHVLGESARISGKRLFPSASM